MYDFDLENYSEILRTESEIRHLKNDIMNIEIGMMSGMYDRWVCMVSLDQSNSQVKELEIKLKELKSKEK